MGVEVLMVIVMSVGENCEADGLIGYEEGVMG